MPSWSFQNSKTLGQFFEQLYSDHYTAVRLLSLHDVKRKSVVGKGPLAAVTLCLHHAYRKSNRVWNRKLRGGRAESCCTPMSCPFIIKVDVHLPESCVSVSLSFWLVYLSAHLFILCCLHGSVHASISGCKSHHRICRR